jgi:hypothetical protein
MSVGFMTEASGHKDSESKSNGFHSKNIIKTKYSAV